MGPDQRRLERQSSMPSERPKSNYGNYPMRYFKISAYGARPRDTTPVPSERAESPPYPIHSNHAENGTDSFLDCHHFDAFDHEKSVELIPPGAYPSRRLLHPAAELPSNQRPPSRISDPSKYTRMR